MSVDRLAQRKEGRRRLAGMPRLAREVVARVADSTGIGADDIVSRCRLHSVVVARHEAWSILRGIGWSLPEIGRVFVVDHTTVLTGVRTWRKRRDAQAVTEEPAVRYRIAVGE